jgi:hypothetical protein
MARKLPQDAFDFYLGLGAARSYQATADRFGVTKKAVTKRATKEGWQERAAEIERKARVAIDQKASESIEVMNERHLKAVRLVQARAIDALKSMPLASGMEAVRALDMALRQERLIRGEPSDRTAVSVEEVIKREYRSWMAVEVSAGDGVEVKEDGDG